MPRKVGKMLTIFLVSFIILSACGTNQDKSAKELNTSEDYFHMTMMGGRTGGAWSIFSEGVAEAVRRENESTIVTVEPGGIVENPVYVGTNKVPYGLSYAMTAYAAYRGNAPYNQAYGDLRAISVIVPANYYQFIVRAEVEYESLDEMIEKQFPIRLAVDQVGSAGEIITRTILQEYGVTYDDIFSWGGSVDHLSDSKTFELMADKRMDATGDAVSVPSSSIIEASATNELKLISINPTVIKSVSEKLGMETGIIKAGSYEFLDNDIETLNTPAILMVNKNVPEDEVYKITEAIYEHLDYLSTVHKEFKKLTPDKMSNVGSVPLHPGAEKFFNEKGLMN
ncbi:TAXI family TRAP transporter solute-binding subunit [Oceanobacillus sp. Castelsardo]|uniref:TAXI family TRAP transporter solute-binding subunit n=1 Tax=Oceanobacillus sp. Castelsardo TaxID=1851204 RepID=UPI0008389DC3|nr:TAXI family TRAP transporter solute-binding subunit [Oceanobacillus sp. Castelsardo]